MVAIFQSTLSVRRATDGGREVSDGLLVSIHALRKESDQDVVRHEVEWLVSIHALRKESDQLRRLIMADETTVSIHALRKESDPCSWTFLSTF